VAAKGADMSNIDVSKMKIALSSIGETLHKQKSNPSKYFSTSEDAFRLGVDNRRKALKLLGTITQPFTPTHVEIDTPFLIWASRNGTQASDILIDSHIEKSNNWAKIALRTEASGNDKVSFYFFWQNTTGSGVVVNVSSYLMLNGFCEAHADHGWIWIPYWGANTIGFSNLSVDAELSPLEWWNQPPTQPLHEPGQLQNVVTLNTSGGWGFLSPGETKSEYVSDNYHVTYDMFHIPRDAAAVFEVSLNLNYYSYNGSVYVDFSPDTYLVLCPYLQLEVFSEVTSTSAS
jgi:hypothetical protein